MAYTINANAKNVWIRDNEDTRDLSIQTDASSVYLDNGRTLEHELGEGSMVSNVVTVDSAMSKVIDGTLDGAYESLVFKGKSLVNLVRLNSKITSSSPIDINILPIDHTKTYLLKVRINEAPTFTNESDSQLALKVQYFSTNDAKGFTAISNSNMVKGYELTKIVTPTLESNTNGKFSLWIPRYISGTLDVDVVFIPYQEGMEEWDIPYFEGLCDSKMPILRNVGKNLSDGKLESGRYAQKQGVPFPDNTAVRTVNKIKVKPSTVYTLKIEDGTSLYNTSEYCNGVYIGFKTASNSLTFTTSPTTNELHLSFKTDNINLQYQIEEGSTATTYEDHKTNILRTSEEIVLRSLPNGVCDMFNTRTGVYTQRIEEIVLDNSQTYLIPTGESFETIQRFKLVLSKNIKASTTTTNGIAICDKLKIEGTSLADEERMFITTGSSGSIMYFNLLKTKATNLTELQSYLQSNPITVQYELSEPITTIVEPLTIPFAYQNGHIILESGYEGQSLLPTLEYSTVVNRTGQVESVAKTIQTQEKQLTMLEQMLIQNIIGLDYNNTVLALNLEINEVM